MTTTTKAQSLSLPFRFEKMKAAAGLVCCMALMAGTARGQVQNNTPATAPASPADMLRQANMQGLVPQAYPNQSSAVAAEGSTLPISLGDLIDVQVFATPELSGSSRVDENGDITLPISGKVHVVGLNPTQAAVVIQDHLKSAQIMIDPHVRVFTVQFASQGVTVLGEVARPGTYQLPGTHMLWDAIATAAGFTTNAGRTITIAHHDKPNDPEIVQIDSVGYSARLNAVPIYPGDSIFVARAPNFYVVGDVGRTGEFPLTNDRPNTVLSALALCGGANHTARMSRSAIVRTMPDGTVQTIRLDLMRIMKNKDPDPVLQASDVLVVPRSNAQVLLDTVIPNAAFTVTSAVISALIIR